MMSEDHHGSTSAAVAGATTVIFGKPGRKRPLSRHDNPPIMMPGWIKENVRRSWSAGSHHSLWLTHHLCAKSAGNFPASSPRKPRNRCSILPGFS